MRLKRDGCRGHSRPSVNGGPCPASKWRPVGGDLSTLVTVQRVLAELGQEGPGSMAGRRPGGLSLNLLPHPHPLRVQKPQPRPPRTWKLELEEPVTSVLHGWISQTPGQWRPQPFSVPSWRSCRARARGCLPGPQCLPLLCTWPSSLLLSVTLPRPSGPSRVQQGIPPPASRTSPL